MTQPLSNCVALVTGASRGIGRAIALELGKAGAHVVALARTTGGLEELDDEIRGGAAFVIEALPATPATLDWVFVSPPRGFGAHAPGERLGTYRLGNDIAVAPEDGGAISAADYALGLVDLIEKGDHRRAHVNLAH